MKTKSISFLMGIALAFLALGVAYAETLEGTVAKIDLGQNTFEIEKADGTKMNVWVTEKTAYSGEITALEEMIEGDPVKLEGSQDRSSGNWVARSVDVTLPEGEEEF